MRMQKFFYKSIPFLPVHDIRETIAFYTGELGFVGEWFWGDPPTDAGCHRDSLSLLFHHDPEMAKRIAGFELVMFVDDVDGVFEEFHSNQNILITSNLKDEPWGIREFTIRDINGYVLRVSCSLERIRKLKNPIPQESKIKKPRL
jgi:catechol 2,3-dioxygenase-like lactoylglutathione lyase family enzyme